VTVWTSTDIAIVDVAVMRPILVMNAECVVAVNEFMFTKNGTFKITQTFKTNRYF